MSIPQCTKRPGTSLLESLPPEILRKILIFVTLHQKASSTWSRKLSFQDRDSVNKTTRPIPTSLPCLLTSRALHSAGLSITYRDITTSTSSTFSKLLVQVRCYPPLGNLIRSLDLSLTTDTFSQAEKLANPLPELLRLTPLLRHFKMGPAFQQYFDKTTLQRLFCGLELLESIQLADCDSVHFAWQLQSLFVSSSFQISPSIKSLSLRGCRQLSPGVFQVLLSQLPRLQRLDLGYTQVEAYALNSIPPTARLTHLNISHCSLLGDEIAKFLTSPPATSNLVYLDAEQTNIAEDDVTALLETAPSTLKFLNLKGSTMTSKHIPLLQKLHHLEELSIGSQLRLQDIEAMFFAPDVLKEETEEAIPDVEPTKHHVILNPLDEAVAICKIRRRINKLSSRLAGCKLRYLDISSLPIGEQGRLNMSVLLATTLEIIEVGDFIPAWSPNIERVAKAVGWKLRTVDKTYWFKRSAQI